MKKIDIAPNSGIALNVYKGFNARVEILSSRQMDGGAPGVIVIREDELPDLIATLTKAAGEMGVSTVQGELVKAIKAVEWDADGVCPACESHKSVGHLSACTTAQALAKAE